MASSCQDTAPLLKLRTWDLLQAMLVSQTVDDLEKHDDDRYHDTDFLKQQVLQFLPKLSNNATTTSIGGEDPKKTIRAVPAQNNATSTNDDELWFPKPGDRTTFAFGHGRDASNTRPTKMTPPDGWIIWPLQQHREQFIPLDPAKNGIVRVQQQQQQQQQASSDDDDNANGTTTTTPTYLVKDVLSFEDFHLYIPMKDFDSTPFLKAIEKFDPSDPSNYDYPPIDIIRLASNYRFYWLEWPDELDPDYEEGRFIFFFKMGDDNNNSNDQHQKWYSVLATNWHFEEVCISGKKHIKEIGWETSLAAVPAEWVERLRLGDENGVDADGNDIAIFSL